MSVVKARGTGDIAAGEPHQLLFSHRKRPGEPAVIMCTGYGSDETAMVTGLDPPFALSPVSDRLAEQTATLASFNGAKRWGNDSAITLIGQLWAWMKAKLQVDTRGVHLIGGSMGAAAACNWARQNLSAVRSLTLMIPCVDLEDIRVNDRGGLGASIVTAYGSAASWQAARATHNPTEYAGELAGVPVSLWPSDTDPICVPAAVSAFATQLPRAEIHSQGPVAHSLNGLNGNAIAEWIGAH